MHRKPRFLGFTFDPDLIPQPFRCWVARLLAWLDRIAGSDQVTMDAGDQHLKDSEIVGLTVYWLVVYLPL